RVASSATSKTSELANKPKRNKGINKAKQKIRNHSHQRDSDISADEAEEQMPEKRQRISMVHLYATKQTKFDYKCNICAKVIYIITHVTTHLIILSLINFFKCDYLRVIRCSVGTNASIRRHLANIHELTNLKSKSQALKNGAKIDPVQKTVLDATVIKAIIIDGRPFTDFKKQGNIETK
ncbi:unnamed protein product, partial [Rotaria magnacalcarata]